MKLKIIAFLTLITLFAPLVLSAMPVPFVYLTIVVNSDQDASFHYDLEGEFPDSTDIQTQDLQGSQPLYFFTNGGSYDLSQVETGFKTESISCESDNPETEFLYQQNKVSFTPDVFENITCTFNNKKTLTKNPVLIVPGLLGTEMKKGEELLWADIIRMVNPLNSDGFMDTLLFSANLSPFDSLVNKNDVLRNPDNLYDYTDGLINEFLGQGYAENETLFTFPYDWRYGVSGVMENNKTNVDLLKQKITDILQQTKASEIDVVAHSLGGLLVKKYAMDNPEENKIGKAVFVGVPNTGAPKAIKVLLQGDNFGVLGLNDQEIKKIAENMPSAYDLLPSEQYYNASGNSFIQVVDRVDLFNTAIKNLNYEESKSFLTTDHNLNSLALAGAENLHSENFDGFDLRVVGVDVFSINGCKAGTLGRITEIRFKDILGNQKTVYEKPKQVAGDGTVPFESASNLPIDQQNKYYALQADHGKMPSQNGIRQQIVNIVSLSALDTGKDLFGNNLITQDIEKCGLRGKVIEVYSPIDIFITDQNGNKLGLSDDRSIINEIPNAGFEIWGDHKFVYLPTDNGETYSINLKGTDSGFYTIKIKSIQNNQTDQIKIFSNLPVTENLLGSLDLSENLLFLDEDGNTTTDKTLEPDIIAGPEADEDYLPPESEVELIGEQGKQGFFKSSVSVKITAEDSGEGVFSTSYSINGEDFQKILGDTAEFEILNEGIYEINYFATDKAGNNETEKTISFTIDKTAPEISISFRD